MRAERKWRRTFARAVDGLDGDRPPVARVDAGVHADAARSFSQLLPVRQPAHARSVRTIDGRGSAPPIEDSLVRPDHEAGLHFFCYSATRVDLRLVSNIQEVQRAHPVPEYGAQRNTERLCGSEAARRRLRVSAILVEEKLAELLAAMVQLRGGQETRCVKRAHGTMFL